MSDPFIDEDLLDRFMKECVIPFFPNANYMRAGAMGPANAKRLKSIELDFSSSFRHLVDTPYCYKGPFKFLHFTSLKGLYGMIRDKSIRMYNLSSMDDIDEIKYSLNSLGMDFSSEYQEEDFCGRFYCLSMVHRDVERKGNSLELWRQYGMDGNGVAVELTFNKRKFSQWMAYSLSKIHYGKKPFDFIKKWREKYFSFQAETGFKIRNFDELFAQIHAYHKRDIYRDEREVRLLYDLKKSGFEVGGLEELKRKSESVFFDVNSFNVPTDYSNLELEWDRWKTFTGSMKKYQNEAKYLHPFVKISCVVFGYRFQRKDQIAIVRHIRESLNTNMNFKDTVLRPYFKKDYKEEDLYGVKGD